MKFRWRITAFVAAVAGLGLTAGGAGLPAETLLAKVNGEPVTAAEMQWALRQEKAAAYAHFQAVDGRDFWTTAQAGTTPLEYIRERAMHRLVRQKVQQMLMRRQGLWPDISHAALVASLERENIRRRTAVAAGQAVYGPVEYSEEDYFAYVFGNILLKSRAQFAATERSFTDAELLAAYVREKERAFDRGPWVDVRQIVALVPATARPDQRQAARARLNEVQARLAAGASFAEVAAQYQTKEIPPQRRYRRADLAVGKLETDRWAEAALELRVGETSPAIEDWRGWAIFEAVARAENDPAPFEEVREEVRAQLIEAAYARYIGQLLAQAKIELERPAWDELRPE